MRSHPPKTGRLVTVSPRGLTAGFACPGRERFRSGTPIPSARTRRCDCKNTCTSRGILARRVGRAYRDARMPRDPIVDLRRAIDALPVRTREAMLEGIRSNPIVVGAYTDSNGGICPMLAAHRNGGRVTHLPFARSWDRFAGASKTRQATRRELAILEAQLQSSLLAEDDVDLKAAIADHLELKQRPAPAPEPQIEARRLGGSRIRDLRPKRADGERALERFERELAKL